MVSSCSVKGEEERTSETKKQALLNVECAFVLVIVGAAACVNIILHAVELP